MSPRFSILLPTHNRADVLPFAIASVLAQSEPDFELLIVADGCTDHTREVASRFDDPRIRFFDLPKAPNFGYANRNIALREARGRLIAFAAHDDLLLPDHLALMGDLLDQSGAVWGYSRPLWVTTDGLIVPFCTNLTLPDELRDFMESGNTIPAACVVHTREALEAAGFWPEEIPSAGDWVLWRRMLGMSGLHAAYLPQPTNLHFSADWKKSRFSATREVETLARIAERASWWPAMLRHPPIAETEQATLWRVVDNGGTALVTQLRAATDRVIDKVAWSAIREGIPKLEGALIAKEEAEAQVAILQQTLVAVEQREATALRDAKACLEKARQELHAARHDKDVAVREVESRIEILQRDLLAARRHAELVAREISVSQSEKQDAISELTIVKQEIEALRTSTSWRVTAPLRKLRRALSAH